MIVKNGFLITILFSIFISAIHADSDKPNINGLNADLIDKIATVIVTKKITYMSLECLLFIQPYFKDGMYNIDVRENHNQKCSGDPGTAPMVLWAGVEQETGAILVMSYDTSFKWRKINGETFTDIAKLKTGIGSSVDHPLTATRLYKKIATNCHRIDLKTWSHPTKKIIEKADVSLEWLELCNSKKYPIYGIRFTDNQKQMVTGNYRKFYKDIFIENGKWPLSIVAVKNNTIISLSKVEGKKVIEYEVFSK
jgi:hypothetical protein